jgi:hypothetical protein
VTGRTLPEIIVKFHAVCNFYNHNAILYPAVVFNLYDLPNGGYVSVRYAYARFSSTGQQLSPIRTTGWYSEGFVHSDVQTIYSFGNPNASDTRVQHWANMVPDGWTPSLPDSRYLLSIEGAIWLGGSNFLYTDWVAPFEYTSAGQFSSSPLQTAYCETLA